MASQRTKMIIAGVAIVSIAGVVAGNYYRDLGRRVEVRTEPAAVLDLVSIVSASGEVRPRRFVDISSNVSGRIVDLRVEEGDSVRRGQVLARIDSTRFEAAVAQGDAGLAARQAELERAKADLQVERLSHERIERTHAQQLVSDQEYDQAQARLEMKKSAVTALKSQIAQQQALLDSYRDDLEKTTVVAPMDGVVTNLAKEEGEMVIGAQSFQPTVIMTVADLSVMECEILVDETDIRGVRIGQPATIEVDAFPEVEMPGHVTEIGSSALPRGGATGGSVSAGTSANQAKDFKVVVTLDDPPPLLRPGLNATAEIVTGERPAVLGVPIQSVVVRRIDPSGKVVDPRTADDDDDDEQEYVAGGDEVDGVFVVRDERAYFQQVETDLVGETHVEITSGIAPGDEIVSGSYKTLRTLKHEADIKRPEEKP